MSKKACRSRKRSRTNPTILNRKRKAESDPEEFIAEYSTESNCDRTSDPMDLRVNRDHSRERFCDQEIIPSRSSFSFPYGIENIIACHPLTRPSTLPEVSWAIGEDIWKNMVYKDITYVRNHKIFDSHPELQPMMRAILLDWLIEVCEVYKLHRETFYLAQDLIDRYLDFKKCLPKTQLQLLGITSLFIASKMEEIYPPKLAEFAYVTDGACTDKEILRKELVILMSLDWNICPSTVNAWLGLFLQVATYDSESNPEGFEYQCFSDQSFSELCHLLDLCVLDVSCLRFPYSVLAASAIAHMVSKEIALKVSAFKWADIAECVDWMTPFAEVISDDAIVDGKLFNNSCDSYDIQTHNVGLRLLEKAHARQDELAKKSPSSHARLSPLTPPKSIKKVSLKSRSN